MKRKIISMFSAIAVLTVCLPAGAVNAAEETEGEYIKNFDKKNTYTQNQFTDVNSEWFSSSVQEAYEIGLMYGDSENTFNPNGDIDNAAVIAIAARLHSIYNYGTEKFDENSSVWYEPYIRYAVNEGICDEGIDPNNAATRSFFAGIMGNATDSSIFSQKNTIEDGALSDVTGWYADTVYNFYRAGILSGNDEYGTFAPESSITRGEVAAILSRIVKPSERVSVVLKSKPASVSGTYSIPEDDGSLEAFKQRAIAANLKVLLNGEGKDDIWQNDIWTKYHEEIPGDYIHVPWRDIERKYDGDWIYIYIPNRYLGKSGDAYTMVGDWSLQTGFRSFLGDYTGSMPDGKLSDLYLSKPSVAAYTETYTYDDYTSETEQLIANASYNPAIDSNSVRNFINGYYDTSYLNSLNMMIGYLTDGGNVCYITVNQDDMYRPTPRNENTDKQSEFIFTPISNDLRQWCENNFGKYVIALVAEDLGTPVFLAEVSGYPSSREDAAVQSWDYSDNTLTIQWEYPQVNFINPITVYEESKVDYMRDVSVLLPAQPHLLQDEMPSSYGNSYTLDYNNCEYFEMRVTGDEIFLYKGDGPSITFTLYSDKAVIEDVELEYNFTWDITGFKKSGNGKTVTVSAPKKLNGVIYLPAGFVVDTLFGEETSDNNLSDITKKNDSNSPNRTETIDDDSTIKTEDKYAAEEAEKAAELEELQNNGYAKVCIGASDWASYLYGHKDIHFRFSHSEGIEGYGYEISRSYNGPHIGFNLNSQKACVQVWYNGTEYGEREISISEPREIDGEIYLPVDEILEALEEDGQGFERKKI